MDRLAHKNFSEARRKSRIRSNVSGSSARPRLVVTVSNLHITAQIIDDSAGKTLAYATTVGSKAIGTKTARAEFVGSLIAKNAKKAKINKVVFDRSGRKYHGRIKALAEKARNEGLEF